MRKTIPILLTIALAFSMLLPVSASGASQETEGSGDPPAQCQHSFGAWSDTGDGHSRVCTSCGAAESGSHSWDAGTVTTAPTCTEAGSKTLSCSVCSTVKSESISALGHSFGAWQQTDTASHKHTCTICGAEESASHSWDGGQVTTQATCLAQGEKTYTCGDCGASKKETLPISGHTFSDWSVDETTHSRACTVCGKAESGPHSWSDTPVIIPATCLEEGAFVYVCSGCEGALIEIIPKLTTHTYDNACDPDCNVCGAQREVNHKFSTAWTKNSREHWHACTLCGEKAKVGLHYPGPAATEEKAQLCLTCGYTMTPRLKHTHSFSDTLTWDETGHWYACDGCEDQKDYSPHSFSSPCDSGCTACGYVTDAAHMYGGDWSFDEGGHWPVCTLCGKEGEHEPHVPGTEAAAGKPQLCIVCGYAIAPAQEHIHTYASQWEKDDAAHWKMCECGDRAEKAPHLWDGGKRNKDKTMTYTCTVCGAERREALPAGGFPWWIVIAGLLLACAGCTAALIRYLGRKPSGRYCR